MKNKFKIIISQNEGNAIYIPKNNKGTQIVITNKKDNSVKVYKVGRGKRVLKSGQSETYTFNGKYWIGSSYKNT